MISFIMNMFAVIGIMATFTVFWWAMIEAQTDIPGVNEPSSRGRKEDK